MLFTENDLLHLKMRILTTATPMSVNRYQLEKILISHKIGTLLMIIAKRVKFQSAIIIENRANYYELYYVKYGIASLIEVT